MQTNNNESKGVWDATYQRVMYPHPCGHPGRADSPNVLCPDCHSAQWWKEHGAAYEARFGKRKQ